MRTLRNKDGFMDRCGGKDGKSIAYTGYDYRHEAKVNPNASPLEK